MQTVDSIHDDDTRYHSGLRAAMESLASVSREILVDTVVAGLDAAGVAVALFAPDDSVAFMSKSFIELYDVQPGARSFDDIMRHNYQLGTGLVFSKEIEEWLAIARSRRRSSRHRQFEVDLVDGRWFMVNETVLDGGWVWDVFSDITILKSNERLLRVARDAAQKAAETDSLTGLCNRRAAMAALEAITTLPGKRAANYALALIDLDHFKRINDDHGHLVGDEVLRHFARTCSPLLRQGDILARIGGEEFLLLMPDTGLAAAGRVIERLRLAIAAEKPIPACDLTYTFSAGLAAGLDLGADEIFQRIDRALYRAKHGGRNQCVIADEA